MKPLNIHENYHTLTQIITKICQATDTTPEMIKARGKAPRVVYARILITRHARRANIRPTLIAFAVNKGHSAILHHEDIYERMYLRDKIFKKCANKAAVLLYS